MNLKIQQLGVALDLTDHDVILLESLKCIQQLFNINKVHFIHVIPKRKKFHDSLDQSIEKRTIDYLRSQIESRIEESDFQEDFTLSLVEEQRGFARQMHEFVLNEQIDLFIFGLKSFFKGSGYTWRTFNKYMGCHMLLVRKPITSLDKVFVPIDLDPNSHKTIQYILEELDGIILERTTFIHVSNIPKEFHYRLMVNDLKLINDLSKIDQEILRRFLSDLDGRLSDVALVILDNYKYEIAQAIVHYCISKEPDLLILGNSDSSELEMKYRGSVTDRILTYGENNILIIK